MALASCLLSFENQISGLSLWLNFNYSDNFWILNSKLFFCFIKTRVALAIYSYYNIYVVIYKWDFCFIEFQSVWHFLNSLFEFETSFSALSKPEHLLLSMVIYNILVYFHDKSKKFYFIFLESNFLIFSIHGK